MSLGNHLGNTNGTRASHRFFRHCAAWNGRVAAGSHRTAAVRDKIGLGKSRQRFGPVGEGANRKAKVPALNDSR